MTKSRYEIRTGSARYGVWDTHLEVWQTIKDTHAQAVGWIAVRELNDANPDKPPSSLRIAMPLRD